MVYGEHIQAPQVEYAKLLVSVLNNHLDNIYFVNSGSEAVEAAINSQGNIQADLMFYPQPRLTMAVP